MSKIQFIQLCVFFIGYALFAGKIKIKIQTENIGDLNLQDWPYYCQDVTNIKNYTLHNITNIDNPEFNKQMYIITDGKFSIVNNDIFNNHSLSQIRSYWLPINKNIYQKYDKKIEDISGIFMRMAYALKLNSTDVYYQYKNEYKNSKVNFYTMRNALNKINKKIYDEFIKEYYIDACNSKSKLLKYAAHIRNSRLNDILKKFEMDTYNINSLYLISQYI